MAEATNTAPIIPKPPTRAAMMAASKAAPAAQTPPLGTAAHDMRQDAAAIAPLVEQAPDGAYRVFQKQDPDGPTWEGHMGRMLGSLAIMSLWTAFFISKLSDHKLTFLGLGTGGLGIVAAGAISLGIPMVTGWIGGLFGKNRIQRENAEGKLIEKPTKWNRDAVDQGLGSGITSRGLFLLAGLVLTTGLQFLGYGQKIDKEGNPVAGENNGYIASHWGDLGMAIQIGSLLVAGYSMIKGFFTGADSGKARMEREYQTAEMAYLMKVGRDRPIRSLTPQEGAGLAPITEIGGNVIQTTDPSVISTIGSHIPGHFMMNEHASVGIAPKTTVDFSYLGDHPANQPRRGGRTFSQDVLRNRAASEVSQETASASAL